MIKMDHETLHLAKRLVIAIETMSQDVKNMSAYVYDISCSVSCLVKEKIQEENIPVAAHGECENPPSHTCTAGQEASDKEEYFEPYEQADERSLCPISDTPHGESSFAAMASTNSDAQENADVLATESNPIFNEGIKTEEPSEDEGNAESYDMRNMYGNSEKTDRFLNEVKSEAESLTDSTDETYGVYSTYYNPPEEVTPSRLLKTTELASTDVCRDIHHTEHSSNSAGNREYATHVDIIQEGQARTHQMKSSEDAFFMHTVEDSEETPHKCSLCEKSFKSLSKLKRHSRVHSGERPYKCHVCGKAYTQCSSLNTHMRSHTGEKPYKCNVCEKTFSQNTHLTCHMRSHTGEKPYKCTLCEKAFPQSSVLSLHMRSHTGEKPYSCNECGKAFACKTNLGTHMRTHTGEKPYKCSLCAKLFRQSSALTKHMLKHSADNPF